MDIRDRPRFSEAHFSKRMIDIWNRWRRGSARHANGSDRLVEVKRLYPELDEDIASAFVKNYGFAASLSLLHVLRTICAIAKPKVVVEFGSGLSTIVLARALAPHDGFLISVDESLQWLAHAADKVGGQENVAYVCLPHRHRIHYTALARYILDGCRPDLVLLDGPTGTDRFSPAAMSLYKRLFSSTTFCVVDDTDREDNDRKANELAANFELTKVDLGDPVYQRHKYSVLVPRSFDASVFELGARRFGRRSDSKA